MWPRVHCWVARGKKSLLIVQNDKMMKIKHVKNEVTALIVQNDKRMKRKHVKDTKK